MEHDWIYKQLGETVRRSRKRLGLTQADLAAKMEMSRAALANIESGRQNVMLHQLFMIARAVELNPQDLLPKMDAGVVDPTELPLPDGLTDSQQQQLASLIMRNGSNGKLDDR